MKRFAMSCAAFMTVVGLAACGGGDSSPTAPSTPAPTPTPVTYNGTYTGASMSYTASQGRMYVSASTTIVHSGQSLSFGSLSITAPLLVSYGLGPATLDGGTFRGQNAYSSSGCGTVISSYSGWFSGDGNVMNLTVKLASRCGDVDIRGEMRR